MIIYREENRHQCDFWPKSFSTYSNLIQQIETHIGEKPYRGSHWDKKFSKSNSLKLHIYIHNGEKPLRI